MLNSMINNPATGDPIAIVGVVLAIAAVAIVVVIISSKKNGD